MTISDSAMPNSSSTDLTATDRAAAVAEIYSAIFTSSFVAERNRRSVKDRVGGCIKIGSEHGLEAEHHSAYVLLGEVNDGNFGK